ncbi:dihydropteroate synthase [Halobacteriovorax marinus SJ]|uniref:Dihydropteroate synthase n=1 Tax=Halobacteriovorax marinus (strain ATCC BAA-682 / DSM 15412 / SJ) TaxID=862908 RepID=E1X1U3_HALMS|nr:dihydropteroate synthase [Halobacteriovorax marinus]CBW26603.1 dihydropteroate synthase [Halobacteriovorax marinus SJ]
MKTQTKSLLRTAELFQSNLDQYSNFQMMGVINLTPNSFSDGGRFNDHLDVQKQLDKFREYGCKVFDFGAESTAPFNDAISLEEELSRLEILFDLVRNNSFKEDEVLSLDTYKIEVFREFAALVAKSNLRNKIIFNDVSGALDPELFNLFNDYSFDYIYSHSLVSTRSQASSHMDYLSDELDLRNYFLTARDEFSKRGLLERVAFDPCFGFSKTADQNLRLLESIKNYTDLSQKWLLGISRKSFLRGLSNSKDRSEQFFFSELLHGQVLKNWMRDITEAEVLIRLHDPQIFHFAQLMK